MCTVSMIYDHYHDKWKQPPYVPPYVPTPFVPNVIPNPYVSPITPAEIEEFRKLLDRAREYDKTHNQPDCELEEKRKKVKELAESLGVSIDFL